MGNNPDELMNVTHNTYLSWLTVRPTVFFSKWRPFFMNTGC